MTESDIVRLELGTELVPAGGPYSFIDNFNRVQSTLIRAGLPMSDSNLVLGTATSTGKTISSELFIHPTLRTGRKILYVAPMKALVSEKMDEWGERFKNHRVSILTGDFRGEASVMDDRLRDSDIVVMTTEMMDSQSRRAHRILDHWMRDVGLIVMDEGHIIGSESRGVPGEMGITRTCSLNPDNPPRIVILSATLPNADDFTGWLVRLNGKKTYSLNNAWRPVKLRWEFQPILAGAYAQSRNEMVRKTVALAQSKPDEKFLCFVHEKKTGHNLSKALEKAGINTEFHRADLSAVKRADIESRFKDRNSDLRVIIATSTLAWGCNLPAKNVVILGVTRGISPVDAADIIQMSGRSGRLGIDDSGTCYMMCPAGEISPWTRKVQNSPPVKSALLDERHLRFQILAEIDIGILNHPDDLPPWFDKTLVGRQVDYPEDHFFKAIERLVEMGMLTVKDDQLVVTPLGKVGTSLYFTPDDVYHWYKFMQANKKIETDTQIACLLGSTPSMRQTYVAQEFKGTVPLFLRACQKEGTVHRTVHPFTPYAVWMHLKGEAADQFALKFHLQNMIKDMDRLGHALSRISKISGVPLADDIVVRMKHGIPKRLAFLCSIPGIGPKKAFLMYTAGITDPKALERTDRAVLVNCLGSTTADKVLRHLGRGQ